MLNEYGHKIIIKIAADPKNVSRAKKSEPGPNIFRDIPINHTTRGLSYCLNIFNASYWKHYISVNASVNDYENDKIRLSTF